MTAEKQLAQALQQRAAVLERWMEALRRRSWALARAKAAAEGGPVPMQVVRDRAQAFLDGLAEAVRGEPRRGEGRGGEPRSGEGRAGPALEVGSPAFREPIQILSFTAGWLAGRGLPVGDALALVHGLEEALGLSQLRAFFEALALTVTEAFCAALGQREQARFRDAMEKSQLCCTLHPRLPCLFLVGDPDLQALDDALGRLLMLAVMREAPAFIIEGSALFRPEPVFRSVVERLADEKRVTATGILAGLSPELIEKLREGPGRNLSLHEQLPEAMAEAAAAIGLTWSTRFD
jgi:hypothetical protein